jgi:3-oxoacyl-[acyl-carrier-protein] synthase II
VFGKDIKVNSLKGHIGHSMAACGSMELISIMKMMLKNKVAGTLNLDNIDEQCNVVNHIRSTQEIKINNFVKNSFALGGTNASIVIGRYN